MFHTVPLGDVCTIAEDNSGNLWCGTNDRGIVVYDPSTGSRRWFRVAQTGLGSDIVVSSTVGKDGSLWFGSFDGGLSRYKDGHFTGYRATGRKGDLANDNVWALETDAEGNIIIGTLGGGLQVMNPQTGRFVTYNTRNSGLSSDFILSLSFDAQGNIVMAHEKEYSVLNVRTHKIIKYDKTRSGRCFAVSSINQLLPLLRVFRCMICRPTAWKRCLCLQAFGAWLPALSSKMRPIRFGWPLIKASHMWCLHGKTARGASS